jgi:hypothetical protein
VTYRSAIGSAIFSGEILEEDRVDVLDDLGAHLEERALVRVPEEPNPVGLRTGELKAAAPFVRGATRDASRDYSVP